MGLFSSKKKTTVGTSITRVFEDENLPDSIKSGTYRALFSGMGEPITEYVIDELENSLALKVDRLYEYAEDNYPYGLPSGEFLTATKGREEVRNILNSIEGTDVILDYCYIGPSNILHSGWQKLISSFGYNTETNELTILSQQKEYPVYLENATVVVPKDEYVNYEPGALEQWGDPPESGWTPDRDRWFAAFQLFTEHKPVLADPRVTEETLRIEFVWEEVDPSIPVDPLMPWANQGEIIRDTLDIPLSGLNTESDYFQVCYYVNSVKKYWTYEIGKGTYPVLDEVFDQQDIAGEFFPFIYFRYEKQPQNVDKSSEAYKASSWMLKYLGLDYDSLASSINENPDIADVEQAMLMLSVPASSDNDLENKYLYQFFDTWSASSDAPLFNSPTLASLFKTFTVKDDVTKGAITIKDERFQMVLSHGGIYRKSVAGTIGDIGFCTSSLEEVTVDSPYQYYMDGQILTTTMPVKVTNHVYRKQIAIGVYDEITVSNLKMRYRVYGKYEVTADKDDDILLIPLDFTITKAYNLLDKEQLYARALHFVFNSRVVTKVKWYQRSWFKSVMFVAAVVMTVVTMGQSLVALASAVATGSMAAIGMALWGILVKVALGITIGLVLRQVVKILGMDFAFVVAIVMAIKGSYDAIKAGSVAGAPFAKELLQIATGLVKAVADEIGSLIQDLLSEAESFSKYVEEQLKLLDDAKDLLKTDNFMTPFVLFGETPDEYFNRTVHSGNIGIVGIEAISSYVEMSLTLPKLHDTITIDEYTYG